jgi:high-affinity K+ transport system ATPase subunit B
MNRRPLPWSKLIGIVEIVKILMTRGALTAFSISNEVSVPDALGDVCCLNG